MVFFCPCRAARAGRDRRRRRDPARGAPGPPRRRDLPAAGVGERPAGRGHRPHRPGAPLRLAAASSACRGAGGEAGALEWRKVDLTSLPW